jgi:uncharacterized protein YciI
MTDTGLPDGVAIETTYVVEISYAPDAAEKRPPLRREHLVRVARLKQEGRIIEAGGFLDFSAAMLLVRADNAAEAEALVSDDVYVRGGVWLDDAHARAYGRVIRSKE